ncbi:uncharacterized protein LOC142606251 [Castanea sativa]|uniref:uncharacterized protein LOC142606251 n=1 Tax=Castanea sativa TaxID=21020 RepID=UPI003F64AF46
MGVVSSTMHLKVKYPSGDQVEALIGSQTMARQCLGLQLDIKLRKGPRHQMSKPPRNPKEVPKLTEMTAALNQFISRSVDRPEEDEVLFAYIAVASYVVSLVLVRIDNGVQRPVYYVSKSLHEAEIRYLPLENAISAVVHATRKLPHYFQSHTVVVLTQLLLKSILRSADYTGRIAKWGTILGAFNIKYMPRTSVKGQVLADLVAEFAEPSVEEEEDKQNMDKKSVGMVSLQKPSSWKVYVDGAANLRGLGVELVIVSPEMIVIEKSLRLSFSATNNEAEYEALLAGMAKV